MGHTLITLSYHWSPFEFFIGLRTFENALLIGFQNHFTIKAPKVEKKTKINGQNDPIIAPPVPGSRYASTFVLIKSNTIKKVFIII